MSLFVAKEWWSHKPEFPSECSHSCLLISNIDGESMPITGNGNAEKIITGSFTGHLRMFSPSARAYKIDDLVCEVNLDEPIIAIETGRFISGSNKTALAVLHPKKVSVYLVNAVGGKGGGGGPSYYELTHSYSHRFHHHAYSFTVGPFGGVSNRDHIAILTLDTQILFYEQETLAFSRYLPSSSLLPGAFTYSPKTDTFLIGTSSMQVECIKYSVLGETSQGQHQVNPHHQQTEHKTQFSDEEAIIQQQQQQGGQTGKKLQVEWTVNVGEPILDIQTGRFTAGLPAGQQELLVLTKRSLFTLKENGSIKTQKRLEYSPLAVHCYRTEGVDHILISAEEKAFFVYRSGQLIWAARTPLSAVSMRLATFHGIQGFIVSQSDTNELLMSYMGTTAYSTTSVSGASGTGATNPTQMKELNYEDMDTEHRKLQKVIKNAANDKLQEPKDKLLVKVTTTTDIQDNRCDEENTNTRTQIGKDEQGKQINVTCTVVLHYNGTAPIRNINIAVNLPSAFYTPTPTIQLDHINTIDNNNVNTPQPPYTLTLPIFLLSNIHPSSLHADIVTTYINSEQMCRTARVEFRLPLCLVGRVLPPVKNNVLFYTIDGNKSNPPPLTTLFSDQFQSIQSSDPSLYSSCSHIMSFFYHNFNYDVTVLVSKKNGRYRLQSSHFVAFALLAQELVHRLNQYHSNADNQEQANNTSSSTSPSLAAEPLQLRFEEDLPLSEYYQLIEAYFTCRQQLQALQAKLSNYSTQFRVIQKRLLLRYKEKNPVPLLNFDVLLNETAQKILSLTEQCSTQQTEYNKRCFELSNASQWVILLCSLKFSLNKQNTDFLGHLLHVHGHEDAGLNGFYLPLGTGWCERVDAALVFVLKNILTKSYQKACLEGGTLPPMGNTGSSAVNMETITEIDRVTKHLGMLCDRLGKGMRFILSKDKNELNKLSNQPGTPPASANGERRRASGTSNNNNTTNTPTTNANSGTNTQGPSANYNRRQSGVDSKREDTATLHT